jgi:hypothetical protein
VHACGFHAASALSRNPCRSRRRERRCRPFAVDPRRCAIGRRADVLEHLAWCEDPGCRQVQGVRFVSLSAFMERVRVPFASLDWISAGAGLRPLPSCRRERFKKEEGSMDLVALSLLPQVPLSSPDSIGKTQ